MTEAKSPTIHQRVISIINDLPAIGKDSENTQQGYKFRGIETVLEHLKPLFAEHGVFVTPHVLERSTSERITRGGTTMFEVSLHVQFTFFGHDGDSFTASAWGEGTDMGDKSTNKAMTAAFKNCLLQTFCVAGGQDDMDQTTPEESTPARSAITDKQKGFIRSMLDKLEIAKDNRSAFIAGIVKREVSSLSALTAREASELIEHLKEEVEALTPTDETTEAGDGGA